MEHRKSRGDRNAPCSVEGCDKIHVNRGWCAMHFARWKTHGDPLIEYQRPYESGDAHPAWRGDDVAYHAVHRRLKKYRGPAKKHRCALCGKPALHWAYDGKDPNERKCPKVGCWFSTDLDHYIPLCVPCHSRLDREQRATR